LPVQAALQRRTRGLQGAVAVRRRPVVAQGPSATRPRRGSETRPLPVTRRTRARRGRGAPFAGPTDRTAGFGACAATREWGFGLRRAARGARADGVPRHGARGPAAVAAREVAAAMRRGAAGLPRVADRGVAGAVRHDRFARLQQRAHPCWSRLTRVTTTRVPFSRLTLWRHQGYDVQ